MVDLRKDNVAVVQFSELMTVVASPSRIELRGYVTGEDTPGWVEVKPAPYQNQAPQGIKVISFNLVPDMHIHLSGLSLVVTRGDETFTASLDLEMGGLSLFSRLDYTGASAIYGSVGMLNSDCIIRICSLDSPHLQGRIEWHPVD